MLQVLLVEKFADCVSGGLEALVGIQVGRKLVKTDDFCVYVRKALEKLQLPNEKVKIHSSSIHIYK